MNDDINPQRKTVGRPFEKNDSRINKSGRPKTFDELRRTADLIASEMVPGPNGEMMRGSVHPAAKGEGNRMLYAAHSVMGWWAAFDNKKVVLSSTQLQQFRDAYAALQGNLVFA